MDDQNKLSNIENGQSLSPQLDDKIYEAIRAALEEARTKVVVAVNTAMVSVYWEIGRQIAEAVGDRAEYGRNLLEYLSKRLTAEFGKGYTVANLRNMRQFFQTFQNRYALSSELTWTHYRLLMRIADKTRRDYYADECVACGWTVRQLERQINSFYYERLLATKKSGKERVKNEIYSLEPQKDPAYLIKDPYVLEFLGLKENKDYLENELEQALIDALQEFLLELGKGFSFVSRQKRITTDHGEHYFIDLVF